MVRLAKIRSNDIVLDPMCGAGTILAEVHEAARRSETIRGIQVSGGDNDAAALRAAASNLRRLGSTELTRWDATQLPLPDHSVDVIISNPPFGKQLATPEEIGPLYRDMLASYNQVLRPGGRAVLLVGEFGPLQAAARRVDWKLTQQLRVRVLGQPAVITIWRKGT
jgi:tRNA G10  N-methylase Trm11